MKLRNVEKSRPQNAKILKVMPINVIFQISSFTIWDIIKKTQLNLSSDLIFDIS